MKSKMPWQAILIIILIFIPIFFIIYLGIIEGNGPDFGVIIEIPIIFIFITFLPFVGAILTRKKWGLYGIIILSLIYIFLIIKNLQQFDDHTFLVIILLYFLTIIMLTFYCFKSPFYKREKKILHS